MLKFIIKRVLKGILCVWFIWSMIFFLVRLTGDPTDWMLPDGATDQEIANLRSSLHLDDPITKQYIDSLNDMFHGDAGNSYYYKRDVVELAETGELFANTLHPYSQALMNAIPVPDPTVERKKAMLTG